MRKELFPLVWLEQMWAHPEVPLEEGEKTREELLEELRAKVLQCRRCELHRGKTNYVFGEGSPYAPLMFVGEAPGREEDLQGRPFVGRAGKLLNQLIREIGLDRERDVFIANVLKCRPPGNRDPRQQEIRSCAPWLFSQIRIIRPKVVCALGRYSANVLMNTWNVPMSRYRGQVHELKPFGAKLIVTYHPAAVLRDMAKLEIIRADFRQIKELLEAEG